MPSDAEELKCVRCGLEVRVNRDSFEIFERMHWVCFHFEFEHMGFDPDEECDAPGCPSSPFNSPPARAGLLAPDPAFQELDTAELLAMVPCPAESVLAHAKVCTAVIVTRTVFLADPLARANVVEALGVTSAVPVPARSTCRTCRSRSTSTSRRPT